MTTHTEEVTPSLRDEKCEIEGCQMEDSGVCALHDIEVERRLSMKALVDRIPSLLTKLNVLIGTTAFVGVIIAGSFAYTTLVKAELREDIHVTKKVYDKGMGELRSIVQTLAIVQGRREETFTVQLRELARLNNTLETIVERQREYEDSLNARIDNRFDR